MLTVDEEIYRLTPALVIATVDKLAQLPWKAATATLFGLRGHAVPAARMAEPRLFRRSAGRAGTRPTPRAAWTAAVASRRCGCVRRT